MRCSKDQVARIGDELLFAFGVGTPEKKDTVGELFVHDRDCSVGEGLPAPVTVCSRILVCDRQTSVQEQYSLSGPATEIAIVVCYVPDISLYLPVDIL